MSVDRLKSGAIDFIAPCQGSQVPDLNAEYKKKHMQTSPGLQIYPKTSN